MRKVLPFALCLLVIAMSFYVSTITDSLHAQEAVPISTVKNTTSMSQQEYMSAIMARNSELTAEQQIRRLCEAFLAMAKASVREPARYNPKEMITKNSLNRNTVLYRLSEYEYQSAINRALGWIILRDEISFSDFQAIVKDNTAYATIVESYTYSKTDGFGTDSFRRRKYTFELSLTATGW
jgi:hypothetical protein